MHHTILASYTTNKVVPVSVLGISLYSFSGDSKLIAYGILTLLTLLRFKMFYMFQNRYSDNCVNLFSFVRLLACF